MSKLTLTQLKKYLGERTHDELVQEIGELYTKIEAVKDYYQVRLGTDEEALEKYKAAIEQEFFPKRGLGEGRLRVARKAVTDFQKVSKAPGSLVDLMLFYVETGIRFTREYGDINEAFYDSIEGMYENALSLITKNDLFEQFKDRCEEIVSDTGGIGWGFHDNLAEMYADFLEIHNL